MGFYTFFFGQAGQCSHRPLSYRKPYMSAMTTALISRYHWLLYVLVFTLVDCSPSYPTKSIMASSHSDILGNEARTRQDTCGSTGNSGGCPPTGERNESCTYECSLLHEPPPEYNNTCEFIEANCADEYELLNYLQFMDCHLGPNLRVCTFSSVSKFIIKFSGTLCTSFYSHLDTSC